MWGSDSSVPDSPLCSEGWEINRWAGGVHSFIHQAGGLGASHGLDDSSSAGGTLACHGSWGGSCRVRGTVCVLRPCPSGGGTLFLHCKHFQQIYACTPIK